MLGQLMNIVAVPELGIADGNADQLVIELVLILHDHQADDAGLHEGQGIDRFGSQHEDIEGIAVVGEGLGNEAVVGGIIDRRVEDAIELQKARFLVELVLVGTPHRDLDDRLDDPLILLIPGRNVVPGVRGDLVVGIGNLGHAGWKRGR